MYERKYFYLLFEKYCYCHKYFYFYFSNFLQNYLYFYSSKNIPKYLYFYLSTNVNYFLQHCSFQPTPSNFTQRHVFYFHWSNIRSQQP